VQDPSSFAQLRVFLGALCGFGFRILPQRTLELAKDRKVSRIGTTVCATEARIENAVVSLARIQLTAMSKAFHGHHRF